MSDIANKLLFFLPIVQIQLSFETIQELIFTEPEWLRSKSNYIIYKISKQKCWQSIYKRRMRGQSTHRKIWQQEADGWMDVYHIKNNVGEPLIINLKNNDGQLINMLKSISSKADNSRTKELWRHPKDKENKALPHFSSRWTWGTLWFKIQNCRCFQFWITPNSQKNISSTDAELHAVSVCGGLRICAYCNDWHSCCGAVELGHRVEVLLDLPSHRQLVLVLWHTIILENTKNKASATLPVDQAAYSFSAVLVRTQAILVKRLTSTCRTYIDPWVIEHLHGGVPLIYLHLQHPSDQSLKTDMITMSTQYNDVI